jgi:hypothetical protein
MRRNLAALTLSAGMVALVVAACSEGVTPPTPPTGFAPGDAVTPPGSAVASKVVVCKTGDVGGTIDVSGVQFGTSTGFASVGSNYAIATGTCREVASDNSPAGNGTTVSVSEDAQANVTVGVTCVDNAANTCNPASLSLNSIHGYLITFNNDLDEPEGGCTFTKGWYRNHGSDTVEGLDGLTKAQVQAIFNATPGQPGNVTFTSNNLLNLYQQLAAAILNGGQSSGNTAVQNAITAALAGTTVTVGANIAITTSLNQGQISALISTLSNFNEGGVAGFPHCSDEVPA